MYKREAAKQSRINGWQFDVGARQRLDGGNAFWAIEARQGDGDPVTTHCGSGRKLPTLPRTAADCPACRIAETASA